MSINLSWHLHRKRSISHFSLALYQNLRRGKRQLLLCYRIGTEGPHWPHLLFNTRWIDISNTKSRSRSQRAPNLRFTSERLERERKENTKRTEEGTLLIDKAFSLCSSSINAAIAVAKRSQNNSKSILFRPLPAFLLILIFHSNSHLLILSKRWIVDCNQ